MLMIRLQRMGKKKKPTYRFVINEKARDTQAKRLEILGHYSPTENPKVLELKVDRIKHWLSVGAQASETVHNILVREGIVEGKKRKSVTITNKRKAKLGEKQVAEEEKKKAEAEAPAEEKVEEPKEETPAEEPKAEEVPKAEVKVEEKPVEVPVEVPTTPTTQLSMSYKKWSFSPTKLTVKQGDKVSLTVSADTSNPSFALPGLTFGIPGLGVEKSVEGTGTVEFTADKVGSFEFGCTSCSGTQASVMKGTLVVE